MQSLSNRNQSNTKTRKELEAISQKIKDSKLKVEDIIIPAAVGLIFIILAVFVFVPMIKSAIEFRQEFATISEKEKTLEELEKQVSGIDDALIQVDLINAKAVIPKTLQVSSFVYYIDSLATELSLQSKSISAGDVQISATDNEEKDIKRSYLGVSGPLSYTGSLENVLNFLDSLYSASPYIVSAENISLKGSTSGSWVVTLNVTGYYVPETNKEVNLYGRYTSYSSFGDILQVFAEKAEKLK